MIVTIDDEQVEKKDVYEDQTAFTVSIEGTGTVTVKVSIDGSRRAMRTFNFNTDTTLTIDSQ